VLFERSSFESELEYLGLRAARREREVDPLLAADTIDTDAAQPYYAATAMARVEALPTTKQLKAAKKWNADRHPAISGIEAATLRTRLEHYLDAKAIATAVAADKSLATFATDDAAMLAVYAHQFQQKVYADAKHHDGQIGEGTLDALGFVRHRGPKLNAVDGTSESFHTGKDKKGKSTAYERIVEVHAADPHVFDSLGSDVSPKTWYRLFANPPFLGRPFTRGVHVELVRKLRLAETWLAGQKAYADLTPVELGRKLKLVEDHHGGRVKDKKSTSMHTFGLAVDIGYTANPWIAGNPDRPNGNAAFIAISKRVSNLLSGTDDALDPAWLAALGDDANTTTGAAYDAIRALHDALLVYLGLANDRPALETTIKRRQSGLRPELVVKAGETVAKAVERWTDTITKDEERLRNAFGDGRDPRKGFLNLSRDLVIALRDHGCLAWGAIDLGANQSGDIMHFDCRATGIGRAIRPPKAHEITKGHPCVATTSDTEQQVSTTTPATTAHRGGRVFTITPSALAMDIAVFVPAAAAKATELEVLVFAHGLNRCGASGSRPKRAADFITGSVFGLGKIIAAAKRPMALVVPGLDWENLAANKMAFTAPGLKKDRQHRLAQPANLNGVLDEVLAAIGRVQGATSAPNLTRLVVAGHSRAYDFLNPLAAAHADAEMTRGALSKLTHVWAFDTTYNCPTTLYASWLATNAALNIEVFYRNAIGTKKCGKLFASAAAKTKGRMVVTVAGESHCSVPAKRLPDLLAALP
jgi:hypothetical protein